MAEKGFDLKVLIPTNDGLTVSETGVRNCKYYLTYNVSNRSYQFAEKVKRDEIFKSEFFSKELFLNYCKKLNIDKIITITGSVDIKHLEIKTEELEIATVLNNLIDKIDIGEL